MTMAAPALVRRAHEDYVAAGADVLITNTFMSGIGTSSRWRWSISRVAPSRPGTSAKSASPCDTVGPMARTPLDGAARLACADVLHKRFEALPETATVDDVRRWFAASSHRKMAFLADGDRYVGSLTREDVAEPLDAGRAATEVARPGPTVAPDAPALSGRDVAIAGGALRVPVVDGGGRLLGVVAVTEDLAGFCG
jgi:CBS domain-containing protein